MIHGEQVKRLVKKDLKGSAAMDEYESIFKNLPVRKVGTKSVLITRPLLRRIILLLKQRKI